MRNLVYVAKYVQKCTIDKTWKSTSRLHSEFWWSIIVVHLLCQACVSYNFNKNNALKLFPWPKVMKHCWTTLAFYNYWSFEKSKNSQ